MIKILVAEDEESIAKLIIMNLKHAGFAPVWAEDGEKAADLLMTEDFDLALLDIMLPEIDGYELLDYAKKLQVPVIFLTALGNTEHKVKGLKMGADDYLAKPFEITELLARIEAVLRRFHKTETTLRAFDVTIDSDSMSVLKNGLPISLTIKEFELLCYFMKNRGIVLYRDKIYEKIWGGEYLDQSRTVDLHVQRLKKKLNWNKEIVAVYKVGYKLEKGDLK